MRSLILLSLFLFSACKPEKGEITTYFFIRHAEKQTSDSSEKDPELTSMGKERAKRWAKVFRDVEFDHIYSSDYKRTFQTARPIAQAKGLEIDRYDTRKLNDEQFQERTIGKKVLVVGHSNLNPQWVNYILKENRYQDLDETVYGSLFLVQIHPDGSRTSHVLHFD